MFTSFSTHLQEFVDCWLILTRENVTKNRTELTEIRYHSDGELGLNHHQERLIFTVYIIFIENTHIIGVNPLRQASLESG